MRALPALPATGQCEQARAEQVAGEVLQGDGGLAPLPALAELAQVGEHHARQDGLERERGDQAVEDCMRRVRVHGVQRLAQLSNPALDGIALLDAARGTLAGGSQPSRLGGRQPAVEMRLHGPHAPLVLGGVEAQTALGSGRMKQAVAALPRPQELRAHAHAPAELADTQTVLYVLRHSRTVQDLAAM